MLEKIKNGEITELQFETPTEVNSLVNFITKHDLQNHLHAFRFSEEDMECDFFIDDIKITCKSLKGYRYNHFLTFFRAENEN